MNDLDALMLNVTGQQPTPTSGTPGIAEYLADLLRTSVQVGLTNNQTRATQANTRLRKAATENNQAQLQDYRGQILGRKDILLAAGELLDAEQHYALKMLRKMLPPDQYRAVVSEAIITASDEAQLYARQSLNRAFQTDKLAPQQLLSLLNANQQRPLAGVVEAAPSEGQIQDMVNTVYAQLRTLAPHDQELKLAQIAEGLESRYSSAIAAAITNRVLAMLNGTTARPGI